MSEDIKQVVQKVFEQVWNQGDTSAADQIFADNKHSNEKKYENLSKEERKTCQDVNQIVGTERW